MKNLPATKAGAAVDLIRDSLEHVLAVAFPKSRSASYAAALNLAQQADKCGEYPMELKIGMSEKLLKMGYTGQADLVGEDQNARVYRTYGALVSVCKGKVVRWVRQ